MPAHALPLNHQAAADDDDRIGLGVAAVVVTAMAVLITWPQALSLSGTFAAHTDAYFSTWRLLWIAHALRTDPAHLFDTNIFYPSTGTLAYSDATLLQGFIATPFIWAGVSPILMYNLLLLAGYVGSGLAMFVLARYLTGRSGPALVAAAVFTLAPYRTEHFMHLEMQWSMWIPLAFWALHRTIDERSWRFGALSGLFIGLQVLSCVYYGVFLVLLLLVLVPVLLLRTPGLGVRALPMLAAGAVVAATLAIPYALPYAANAQTLGERPLEDILSLSATPLNYLASPGPNVWWGWTSDRWGENERRLFPGLVAILLALVGLTTTSRRDAWLYAALVVVSVELSFGLHGHLYGWIASHVQALHGLRSPARFGILVATTLAVVAGFGASMLEARRRTLVAIVLVLIAIESINRPMQLEAITPPDPSAYDVYRAIRSQGPGVILELPVPRLDRLPGFDATYQFASASHWYKLINGYSGYYPQVYAETLNVMTNFPDRESIARLQRLDVRYLVIHRELYEPAAYNALMIALGSDPRFQPFGSFKTGMTGTKEATLFLLSPAR